MRIAVHKNSDMLFDTNWIKILINKGVDVKIVNMRDDSALDIVKECDGVMWHFHHSPLDKNCAPKILSVIEDYLKIPVWPNRCTREFFDEKVAQYYFMKLTGVPHVPTWVFWNYEKACDFIMREAEFPMVFKLSVGAGGANVLKVDTQKDALAMTNQMFKIGMEPYSFNEFRKRQTITQKLLYPEYYQIQKEYVYFQKYLPNNKDIRITVIGDRAFGYCRLNRKDDFRASGSGRIVYDMGNIPEEAIRTAFYLSDIGHFQSMAYDFLLDNGRPVVNEMSYGYVSKLVYDCSGHWDKNLNWIKGHMLPEEAQIEDFIKYIAGCK